MAFKRLRDLDVRGKRVFIRSDLNVPQDEHGNITDDSRIRASVPAINDASTRGAAVMVSHLGRPSEGQWNAADSLAPIAQQLGVARHPLPLIRDWVDGGAWHDALQPGQIVLLENCRFNKGEKKNDDALAQKMGRLCDIYCNDAFGTAHRAEGTTHGITKYAPIACAGPLLAAELDALGKALANPRRPLVAIVGGAKVSTKLTVLRALAAKVDVLIVGGGIANTFILAAGGTIGKSLAEPDLVGEAQASSTRSPAKSHYRSTVYAGIFTDGDGVTEAVETSKLTILILDIGPMTVAALKWSSPKPNGVWNGPSASSSSMRLRRCTGRSPKRRARACFRLPQATRLPRSTSSESPTGFPSHRAARFEFRGQTLPAVDSGRTRR
jgi:phosphoglycerate kinase